MHPNQIIIQNNLIYKLLETELRHLQIVSFERILHGISSNVFKLTGIDENLYLRIASSPEENLTAEVKIHQLLNKEGILVPNVLAHEDFCPILENRSYMVISEIGGGPFKDSTPNESVLNQAGRELARINLVMLDGFGSIKKYTKKVTGIRGYLNSFKDFMLTDFDKHLTKLVSNKIINSKEEISIKSFINQNLRYFEIKSGYLMHGGYTTEHIFMKNGLYAGLIDFGDAKVTNRLFDLAYFKICNREYFPQLLTGYLEVAPKDDFWEDEMFITTVIVGARVISYLIDDYKYINEKLQGNKKILSFLEEVKAI